MKSSGKAAYSARRLAAEALVRVAEKGAYSNLILDGMLKKSGLDSRDTAFSSALFYGALERRATLDHIIAAHCPHKLSPAVRAVLQTALVQLLYMEQIPASAAVSEAVTLCRQMGQTRSAGLVNGVLRSFLRADKKIPPITGNDAQRLAVELSCSAPLAECLISWLNIDTARAVLEAALGAAPTFLRVNRLKITEDELIERLLEEGLSARRGPIPGSLILDSGDAAGSKAHGEGLFYVQDLSSQEAALALGALPGERLLDVCAAPGGKSFCLAIEAGDSGEIISCDIHPHRVGLIESGARRLGLSSITAMARDGLIFDPDLGLFDRVLCDVPCSGLGVMRRKPELKYTDPKDFAGLPKLQLNMLTNASRYLKPGGRLIYSTCTLNPAENCEVVGRFLADNSDFAPLPTDRGEFCRTILPADKEGGDGFFIAVMERKGGGDA